MGNKDEVTGRLKEAAGALTEDERMKREGQVDQKGAVKHKIDVAADKVKDKL